MCALKFQFDPNQQYQLDAISSVVDLFRGIPNRVPAFSLSGDVVPNIPEHEAINWEPVYDNFLEVQKRNAIAPNTLLAELEMDDGLVLEDVGVESRSYPHFTVEMETGTGKTYVYLRTIYELRKNYGFSKFIIIVPSIAIYEGVIKSFDTMKDHFRTLYGNDPVYLSPYDGEHVANIKTFATSTFTQIMVMTIDSFNKATNVIYKPSDKIIGELKAFQYIQKVRPVLIIDEPQSSVNSDKARSACRTLHPLFALRYSATHRESPNQIYKLSPFEAYRQNLVKKIEVIGVTELNAFGKPFMSLEKVGRDSRGIYANLRTNIYDKNRIKEALVILRQSDDLFDKTNRGEYKGQSYKVSEISLRPGNQFIAFENGFKLAYGKSIGPVKHKIFEKQIEEAVLKHMSRQEALKERGIKVLSLFFIDKVDNYVTKDGVIKKLFDACFEKHKVHFPHFKKYDAASVREAYFAKRKDKKTGQEEAIDTEGKTKPEREMEKEAFELIMKKKEQLLSFSEPVSFIFAHSALKEGWDNPNVFQICTLNQTESEVKKRQEIGRGLRLSVDQSGARIFDDSINVLTIVANESYEQYAGTLQTEYQEDGDAPPPPPTNANREPARRNDEIFRSKEFHAFCKKLFKEAEYDIQLDSAKLIAKCVAKINSAQFDMHRIVVERGRFLMIEYQLELLSIKNEKAKIRITRKDTDDSQLSNEHSFSVGDNLASAMNNDKYLQGYTIVAIIDDGDEQKVDFRRAILRKEEAIRFQVAGKYDVERDATSPSTRPPVFDLIGRTAHATGLTRPTINRIFKELKSEVKKKFLINPEGFANIFGAIIQSELADHVAEKIQYTVKERALDVKLEEIFPAAKSFPQKELIPGGEKSLYDRIQVDSDKERHFVDDDLANDIANIAFFLKFPPTFKIPIPKVIGNYNPDWGILREYESKNTLELIRETKGSSDLEKLQFPNEKRKIWCALKYFAQLGIDYRVIDPDNREDKPYWKLADGSSEPSLFKAKSK